MILCNIHIMGYDIKQYDKECIISIMQRIISYISKTPQSLSKEASLPPPNYSRRKNNCQKI